MADTDEVNDEEIADGEESAEEDGKQKKFPMMMIIIGAAVVVLVGGAGGAYFMGLFGGGPMDAQKSEAQAPSIYFDIPEMVVNLASGRKRPQYLKLKIAIEADSQENIDALTPKMPRIQDMFLIYLREMRGSDLEGSAGVYRLKNELMRRINITIHPAEIKRVLFKEMIIQ
ncbi:MAG: flagellar basal body-associated protein FliL [bacterium]|nr:flagellar basal body-associated protein FliL [bacterium]